MCKCHSRKRHHAVGAGIDSVAETVRTTDYKKYIALRICHHPVKIGGKLPRGRHFPTLVKQYDHVAAGYI